MFNFVDRNLCPLCGSADRQALWTSRYSDPAVARFMAGFHYTADVPAALGDEHFALVRCDRCQMVYHARRPDDSALQRIYSDWTDQAQVRQFEAEHRSPVAGEEGRQRLKTVLRLHCLARRAFPGTGPMRLLDFGCGNGESMRAAQLIGFDAVGTDLSVSRAGAALVSGCPVHTDLDAFDQAGEAPVHAAILSQVLEHLVAPRETLEAIRERMAPGGVLHLAVPDGSGISVPQDFAQFHTVQPLEHLNVFTPETLARMAERAGFSRCRRPAAFLGTSQLQATRTALGMIWRRNTTNAYSAGPRVPALA